MFFDKVKAIGWGFSGAIGVGAASAGLEYSGTVDWAGLGTFGPGLGLAVGAGLSFLVGYFKKERTGYGAGVPVFEDEIPGGELMPSGGERTG